MAHLSDAPGAPAQAAWEAARQPEGSSNGLDLTAMRAGPLPVPQPRKQLSLTRLAWMVTVTWLVAVASYVLGFVSSAQGAFMTIVSQVPLPDLLLFVIFCMVPLTMIWAVAATAQPKAPAEEIRAQTATAAKIATELTALHEVAAEQRRLLIKAFDTTAQELENRFEAMSAELVGKVDQVTEEARTTLNRRGEALDHAMARLENRIDAGMAERLSQIEGQLGEAGNRLDAKLEEQGHELRGVLADRGASFDQMLAESQKKLVALVSSRLEDSDGKSLDALAQQLTDVSEALTSEERAPEAATEGLSKELDRLSDAVAQLCERLDALGTVEEPAAPIPPAAEEPDLSDLDLEEGDTPLDWAKLLGAMALSGSDEDDETYGADDQILRRLVPVGRRLQSRLAAEGLFVQDLTPEQAAPDSWERYVNGERDPILAEDLAGITDPVAIALVRASIKGDEAFRENVAAYMVLYQKLLERAVRQERNGADLIGLAETNGGRLFTLIGSVTGIFAT